MVIINQHPVRKFRSALEYHLSQAQSLGRKYQMLKLVGAPHKRLHNIDRAMKWHIKKATCMVNHDNPR